MQLFCKFAVLPGRSKTVQDSVLIIQPSASLECDACVEEASAADGTLLLRVPPGLRDAALLPLLEPYSAYRVWRLSLAGVGAPSRAFGGFADPEAARQLDSRVDWMTTEFCCRFGPAVTATAVQLPPCDDTRAELLGSLDVLPLAIWPCFPKPNRAGGRRRLRGTTSRTKSW